MVLLFVCCFFFLDVGAAASNCGEDGVPLVDGDFLVLINGWWER